MKARYLFLAAILATPAFGQPPGGPPGQRGPGGPGGGPPGGPGGGGSPNAVLAAIDADGNHTITAREILNAAAALKKLDQNGDGQLTSDEVHGSRNAGIQGRGGFGQGGRNNRGGQLGGGAQGARNQGGRQGGPPGAGGPPGGQGGHGQHGGRGPHSVEDFMEHAMSFDANKDGMLSKAELQKMAAAVIEESQRRGGPPGAEGRNGGRTGRQGTSNRQRPALDK